MVDLTFCLGCYCKAVALKHNNFMKRGARKLWLWVSIVSELFEHTLLGSFDDFFLVLFVLRLAVHFLDKLGNATLPDCQQMACKKGAAFPLLTPHKNTVTIPAVTSHSNGNNSSY